jgi:predicted ATPase
MINSIRLQNFKGFRDATLSTGPLTVIAGANASGKSNLRDAFRFVHGIGRGYSLADIVGEKYVEGLLQWRGIRGGSREVATYGQPSFSVETAWSTSSDAASAERYLHHITVGVSSGRRPLRVLREFLHRNNELVYDATPRDQPRGEGSEGLSVQVGSLYSPAPRSRDLPFNDEYPVLWALSMHPDFDSSLHIRTGAAVFRLRRMRFLDLAPAAMKTPSVPGQRLGDRGENLSSVLYAICEDASRKQAMTEWLRNLTPLDVVDFEFPTDLTGKILVTLVESSGRKTSAYSASDGTLRFLAMLAALMGDDVPTFYFLEEIDNGIHPTRLSLLLELIEQHVRRSETQVVATTHSPQLLAMLSPEARENAYLAYRFEDETESHLKRIVDLPNAREVLERQSLARLHESGWMENVATLLRQEDEGA